VAGCGLEIVSATLPVKVVLRMLVPLSDRRLAGLASGTLQAVARMVGEYKAVVASPQRKDPFLGEETV
jgi:ABC-type molybdate transport system permease subunit